MPMRSPFEQDAIACAHAGGSPSSFGRALQTCGDSAFGHRALKMANLASTIDEAHSDKRLWRQATRYLRRT
jgi:hypothetical protein